MVLLFPVLSHATSLHLPLLPSIAAQGPVWVVVVAQKASPDTYAAPLDHDQAVPLYDRPMYAVDTADIAGKGREGKRWLVR